eukprot:1960040-Rhodomonas_salina.2
MSGTDTALAAGVYKGASLVTRRVQTVPPYARWRNTHLVWCDRAMHGTDMLYGTVRCMVLTCCMALCDAWY